MAAIISPTQSLNAELELDGVRAGRHLPRVSRAPMAAISTPPRHHMIQPADAAEIVRTRSG
jgi:hypothetical protein